MQAAIDATALALANEPLTLTDQEFATRARALFDRNFTGRDETTVDSFSASRQATTISVSASGHVATSLLAVLHMPTIAFGARNQADRATHKVEVALVLDNTGSMNQSGKMDALKSAAHSLLDIMENAAGQASSPDAVKIAIVPFTTQVRFDTALSDQPWIFFDSSKEVLSKAISPATWAGCITDRDQPYDTDDTVPDTGPYDPHDTMQSTTNWWGQTVWQVGTQEATTKYWAAVCDQSTLTPIQTLTNDFTQLHNEVTAMTAGGNTNVTIGVQTGFALLSPSAPFTDGAAYDDTDVKKYMVVLTDGENTQDRFSSRASSIDARTSAACTAVKATGDITVFTIRVMDGDAGLLQSCASNSSMYFDVTDASQLVPVFQAIANQITSLRLTS
jgi:Mg-chelatase subunit ChlD